MNLRNLHRALLASAVAVLAFGTAPAMAGPFGQQAFGSCDGGATAGGCTTTNGHVSVSVASTLTINEERAISFGNIAANTPAATATLVLGTDGSRTLGGSGTAFSLLHGASATGGAGPALAGAQSPGHYTIEGGAEDLASATQVYISFADSGGNPIDMCSPGGPCDAYHPSIAHSNQVALSGPGVGTLYVDKFVINESGSDAYGHFVKNDGSVGIVAPYGHANPTTVTGSGVADVVVGATLHGGGTALTAGKYTGQFEMMASY